MLSSLSRSWPKKAMLPVVAHPVQIKGPQGLVPFFTSSIIGCRWLGPLSKWSMTSVNLGTFQDGDLLPNTQTTMAKKGQYVKSQETGTALDRASAEQLKMSSPILPPPKLHTQEKKRKKILFRSKVWLTWTNLLKWYLAIWSHVCVFWTVCEVCMDGTSLK